MTALNPDTLTELAEQVETQLAALRLAGSAAGLARTKEAEPSGRPDDAEQRAVVEQAAGESFGVFWEKFRGKLRDDLCLEGGYLHGQWQKWQDLSAKDTVERSYFWLAALGIAGSALNPAAVAISVIVLNTLTSIGIKAICDDCGKAD
ncbi:hypothetical protein ACQE3D_21755 [Methylomonas sp. MS20]|uniref:hypothetical protein n=1 Tax=unclassified Methylomonas TaxID=2608980 RepID=UPI0028A3CF3F|nr:hypothetical protein [Methylomonas sp. MV1]MDT4332191.1 hypothetical protein [Methylomonas sp. MV1]